MERNGGDAASQTYTGKCPREPQAQDAPPTGHQHSLWSNVQWGFHCTTVTSHRRTRASPLTADALEHPPGWSLASSFPESFPSSLESPGAEPDLTHVKLRAEAPRCRCALSAHLPHRLSNRRSHESNWHFLHAPRMFPLSSVALCVRVKPAVLGLPSALCRAPAAAVRNTSEKGTVMQGHRISPKFFPRMSGCSTGVLSNFSFDPGGLSTSPASFGKDFFGCSAAQEEPPLPA